MSVRVTSDPAAFQTTTFGFLQADPVLHTLVLGNVADRAAGRYPAEAEPSYFVSVHADTDADADAGTDSDSDSGTDAAADSDSDADSGTDAAAAADSDSDAAADSDAGTGVRADEVIGVAMRTPGRPVYIGGLREDLATEVAEAYADLLPNLTGVAGARAAARAFAQRWVELRAVAEAGAEGGAAGRELDAEAVARGWAESKGTRLHRLVALTPLAADGELRAMRTGDVSLAAEWMADGFPAEAAFLDASWAERQLAQGTLWFWEVDGEPVSMGSYHLPLFGVSRVGPIYTPPEHRRHGYAGALTGEITARILANSNQACLYTDLANPTSNKIYAQLGYVPLADFVDLTFVP